MAWPRAFIRRRHTPLHKAAWSGHAAAAAALLAHGADVNVKANKGGCGGRSRFSYIDIYAYVYLSIYVDIPICRYI
jgi:ankyrin repeat protein